MSCDWKTILKMCLKAVSQNDRVLLTASGRSESVNLLVTKDKYEIPGTYSEAMESAQNKVNNSM